MLAIDPTMSLVAMKALEGHQAASRQALERLETGKRINRASDDPAGMIAATHLGVQRASLEELLEGHQRTESVLNVMDAGFASIRDRLIELRGVVVRAASEDGLAAGELGALEVEAQGILEGIETTIETTEFNGQHVLRDGVMIDLAGSSQFFGGTSLGGLGLSRDGGPRSEEDESRLPLLEGDLEELAERVERAISTMSSRQAQVGAVLGNGLRASASRVMSELENTAAAQSLIEDADFAEEVSALARSQVLEQGALAVIQLVQEQGARALQLLGG